MSNLHVRYLLVGAGLAGVKAAEGIRELDRDGSVLLVGQEAGRPYNRPPLSKQFLRRELRREELFAVEPQWFERHRVELRTGRRVVGLDLVRGSAQLDNGQEVSFDSLLIATGTSPALMNILGAELPNVFYLRTMDDVARLHNAIDKARAEGRVDTRSHAEGPVRRGRAAVVGAGLLGVEVAASLTQAGIAVDLLCSTRFPWNRFAGENTGQLLEAFLTSRGVVVHPDARPLRLEGDGRVQRVVINRADGPGDDTIPCDFVVACIGATANKDLLRGTAVAAGKAILVDGQCRTNVAGVYAAGDCCAVLDPLFGKHRQLDQWHQALLTGKLAGRNMAGADERYGAVNKLTSEVFDLNLSGWGEARIVDHRLLRGAPQLQPPLLVEIGVAADGRVAQVLVLHHKDQPVEGPLFEELVRRRVQLNGNEERFKDPAVPLGSLL